MVVLSIMETLNKWGDQLKDFVTSNNRNPIFWICIVVGGLLLFFWTYNALNKNQ